MFSLSQATDAAECRPCAIQVQALACTFKCPCRALGGSHAQQRISWAHMLLPVLAMRRLDGKLEIVWETHRELFRLLS